MRLPLKVVALNCKGRASCNHVARHPTQLFWIYVDKLDDFQSFKRAYGKFAGNRRHRAPRGTSSTLAAANATATVTSGAKLLFVASGRGGRLEWNSLEQFVY